MDNNTVDVTIHLSKEVAAAYEAARKSPNNEITVVNADGSKTIRSRHADLGEFLAAQIYNSGQMYTQHIKSPAVLAAEAKAAAAADELNTARSISNGISVTLVGLP